MGFRDVFHDYRTRGYDCRAVSSMRVGEYSLSKHKRFEYECFSGVFSEWCDDWATTVFSLAASGGKYTVPVAKIRSRERHQGETEGDMLFVWMPPDLLKTNIRYLEDFERLVRASYDCHQEVDEVTHMASEIGMLRGHFMDTEEKRKMLYAAMTQVSHVQTEADRKLISAHFCGDSRCTFSQLLILFSKLQVKWDLSYPHWKTWQEELDGKWGVDAQTDSPLKNFERIVKYMQTKESEIKAMRG